MKLLRYGPKDQEKPGLLDAGGVLRDLSGVIADINPQTLAPAELDKLRRIAPASLPAVAGNPRIGPCVGGISKMVCVGLNYSDHAREAGATPPEQPVLFMKAISSITGPYDDVVLPKGHSKADWEVELGVVIGRRTKYVSEAEALSYVAGYCVVNDVSERHFQLECGGDWSKGKGCDTFAPIGPWLVTADEVADPQNLGLWLEVDGRRMQDGNTRTMIFGVRQLVSYVSHFITLHPGDVISTGTPPGVGMGQKPEPVYLRPGQTIRLGIEGLGEQNQRTVGG